ncbi:MurR/RpiR family transcriptional regulator [Acetobacter sp. KSO5]|uniref:MurR/RpiR family transcriptional regulator n=1 Tax=Acetobacter sp. KSO5 TaxID=3373674 RepID=UPI00376F3ECC
MDSWEKMKVSEKKQAATVGEPPGTYEELIRVIYDRYAELSKSYQKIFLYITQNPNYIAVDSVHVLAEKCGVHVSGCVRFAQSLGYKGFKDLQAIFRHRLSTVALGFNARVRASEDDIYPAYFFARAKDF